MEHPATNELRGFEPVYLHFLDSQLSRSVTGFPHVALLRTTIETTLLCRGGPLYCSLSALWESPVARDARVAGLLQLAASHGWLYAYAHQTSTEEFLQTRRDLYGHDRLRYPMYFARTSAAPAPAEVLPKNSDTSAALETGTLAYLSGVGGRIMIPASAALEVPDVQKDVELALSERDGRAMTVTLFDSLRMRGDAGRAALARLSLVMSALYLRDYVTAGSGVILTGIAGLAALDSVAAGGFPESDVPLLTEIRKLVNLPIPWDAGTAGWWQAALAERAGPLHAELVGRIAHLLRLCVNLVPAGAQIPAQRAMTLGILRRSFYGVEPVGPPRDPRGAFDRALRCVHTATKKVTRLTGGNVGSNDGKNKRRHGGAPLVVISGDVRGSSVVIGGRTARVDRVDVGADPVRAFAELLRSHVGDVRREAGDSDRVDAELAIVEAGLLGETVEPQRRRQAITYLREIVLGMAGNAGFAGLVELARQLPM